MKEDKNTFIKWIKEHKKELKIAGISVAVLIALVLAIKNRAALADVMKKVMASVSKSNKTVAAQTVKAVKADSCARVTDIAKAVPQPTQSITTSAQVDRIPFDVHKHVRNLPEGYHASPDKIATALENGIELLENQTWVVDYTKGLPIAG